MKYIRIIWSVALVAMFTEVNAQNMLHTNGGAIVNESQDTIILRGMGLGGWMLQEGYMLQTASFANAQYEIRNKIQELIGEEATQEFYDAWLLNHVTQTDIDSLKSWGFNSVRLPMHYNLYTLPIEDEPVEGENTWLDIGFEMTDSLISWCAQNEMYVILDLHAAPGGQGYDAAISDYDPSKPSLWESQQNRDKMASLWKKLAERYADEQWVGGYDLLNEPNWNLPGGTLIRQLYEQVTDSIRLVDNNHILFIEGNWFANDFTGLTPPWDDNFVYSPHKYWSTNDEASMQFATSLRNAYNVPLYLGESGENSNVWFRDAIKLMEDLGIGWAWWPMKKIDNISGPLSINKSPEYSYLLNYWGGSASEPTAEYTTDALMALTEDLKMENCRYQKDVIDAMFRQVQSDETMPFATHQIPGLFHASDFDLGIVGQAYYDNQVANYNVSTGNYTEWNTGWAYRNDGVDIQGCDDDVNTNGFNVGWIGTDEWMKYTAEIMSSGVYDIHLRIAAGGANGRFHFEVNGADVTPTVSVPSTGDWDNWESLIIEDVILEAGNAEIVFYANNEGFNLSSFEFLETGVSSSSISTAFLSAETLTESSIEMTVNKPLQTPENAFEGDFEIQVNGSAVPILSAALDPLDNRKVIFELDYSMNSLQVIKITHSGSQLTAEDGSLLTLFTLEDVENTLEYAHPIAGIVQAEAYSHQEGVELEDCTDIGGGQNIGYLDSGDYLDYEVIVAESGTYSVDFRTASQAAGGAVQLLEVDENEETTLLGEFSFSGTGGWQTWQTTTDSLELEEGRHTIRLKITQAPFNMNWMEFKYQEIYEGEILYNAGIDVLLPYPNPADDNVLIIFSAFLSQDLTLKIYDSQGRRVFEKLYYETSIFNENLSLANFQDGIYHIALQKEDGTIITSKFLKLSE